MKELLRVYREFDLNSFDINKFSVWIFLLTIFGSLFVLPVAVILMELGLDGITKSAIMDLYPLFKTQVWTVLAMLPLLFLLPTVGFFSWSHLVVLLLNIEIPEQEGYILRRQFLVRGFFSTSLAVVMFIWPIIAIWFVGYTLSLPYLMEYMAFIPKILVTCWLLFTVLLMSLSFHLMTRVPLLRCISIQVIGLVSILGTMILAYMTSQAI